MLRALDLFSGIGGITYGLRGIVSPVVYVEKNDDAREFLKKKNPNTPYSRMYARLTPRI